MSKQAKRRHRNKKQGSLVPLIILMAAAAGVLAAIFLLPGGQVPWLELPEESMVTTTVPVTTTAATTTATTATTAGTTTTTKATTTKTTMTASTADDRYIDSNGLLQFHTDGRYVQAKSYAAGEPIPWNLLLVNDWNPLPDGYDERLDRVTVGHQTVDSRMLADLQAMLEAGKANGIGVQSGYRSVAKQDELYWRQVRYQRNYTNDELKAQTAAGEIVKRPGHSEHHTGLAVDLGGNGNFKLEMDFEYTAAFDWLIEHCHEYGFILRFPKGKEAVTGVIYEPWHYRYVGKEAATYIMENDLCLEEYLAQTGK
ncbi:MAG: M15 family metallopeptidase [Clostridia bacterium]|nr:M15 family metallopeptidase [Clostridia bacterium]